jgi:hypothetical protein
MEGSWGARFPVGQVSIAVCAVLHSCLFQRYAGRILGPYSQETEQKGDQEKREVAPTMSNRLFTAITRLAAHEVRGDSTGCCNLGFNQLQEDLFR